MTITNAQRLPSLKARLAGVFYLITIAVGAFDHFAVGGNLIVRNNPAATAHHILASEHMYRLAFAADMVPVYIVVTVILFDLFKPVNASISLLAAFSSLVGGAVGSAIGVLHIAPLVVFEGGAAFSAFNEQQLQVLSLLLLKLYDQGFTVSLIFFGFYCFLVGCLIIRSTFMPRVVGLLMAIAGVAYLACSFADFVSPSLGVSLSPYAVMLGSVGEVALTLWLLLFGVDSAKWRAQQAASQSNDFDKVAIAP